MEYLSTMEVGTRLSDASVTGIGYMQHCLAQHSREYRSKMRMVEWSMVGHLSALASLFTFGRNLSELILPIGVSMMGWVLFSVYLLWRRTHEFLPQSFTSTALAIEEFRGRLSLREFTDADGRLPWGVARDWLKKELVEVSRCDERANAMIQGLESF